LTDQKEAPDQKGTTDYAGPRVESGGTHAVQHEVDQIEYEEHALICLKVPSNRDQTCGYGERPMLYGVCPKLVQGQTDLLGRLWIQFHFGSYDKNGFVIQSMERG